MPGGCSEILAIRSLDDRERREVTTVQALDSRHKLDLKSEKGEYAVRDSLGAEEEEDGELQGMVSESDF